MRQKCSAAIIGVGPEQGLGATLACYFAAKGLHVFIAGRSENKLHKIADKIEQTGGLATPVVADAIGPSRGFKIKHPQNAQRPPVVNIRTQGHRLFHLSF